MHGGQLASNWYPGFYLWDVHVELDRLTCVLPRSSLGDLQLAHRRPVVCALRIQAPIQNTLAICATKHNVVTVLTFSV